MRKLQQKLCKETSTISSLVSALKACSTMRDLQRGSQLHALASETGQSTNTYVANTLIDMYSKCGSMSQARKVFDSMPSHTIVSWTALILGYAQNEAGLEALQLLELMQSKGFAPNRATFLAALKACGEISSREESVSVSGKLFKLQSLEKVMAIHSQLSRGSEELEIPVCNSLIDIYAKCGSLVDSQRVFDAMKQRTVVSWTALMLGYAQAGEGEKALDLFSGMENQGFEPDAKAFVAALQGCSSAGEKEQGEQISGSFIKTRALERGMAIHLQALKAGHASDLFVANSLIDLYSKCGSMLDARLVFEAMAAHTVVSWTALILGYALNGEAPLALEIFSSMQLRGLCSPNLQTNFAALKACGASGDLETGRTIHAEVRRLGHEKNPTMAASLIEFYGKCGMLWDAQQVFDSIEPSRRTTPMWSVLISGYGRQGRVEDAVKLFKRMQEVEGGLRPDKFTFLAVLAACSHVGMVEKGREFFEAMEIRFGIVPEIAHWHCLIDMLGRVNQLELALETVNRMPFAANAATWTIVLASSRKWKNERIGRMAFEKLVALDEKDPSAYLLMTSILNS